MSPITLNPPQMAALVLVEARIAALNSEAQCLRQLKADGLAVACAAAADALAKAHEAYLGETQRSIRLAVPADVSKLVQAG